MIETERLILRPWTHDDADRLFDMMSRIEVARWSGNGVPMASIDEAHTRIDRMPTRAGDHPAAGLCAAEIKATGVVAGMAVLVPIPASQGIDRDDMEIGWHLHPDSWHQGYATEAASALVTHGFAAGLPALYAVTFPDNEPSQAVCLRLGMTDLGLSTDWYDRELRAFRLAPPAKPVG
ncbi:MAG: family N-acetyltransferase [Aeromicrobium sp.]|nr:family N-acetyltransferase [Aeromicrobium sp.]